MDLKKNINRFSMNLNANQHFIYNKVYNNLSGEWINLPKGKQKIFYKLYWKLLKNQIIQKQKQKWIYNDSLSSVNLIIKLSNTNYNKLCLLNESFFYKKIRYTKYNGARLRGYTSYKEKVLDFKNLNTQHYPLSDYKKLLIYFNNEKN